MIRFQAAFITTNTALSDIPSVVEPGVNEIPMLNDGGTRFVLAEAHRREVGVLVHETLSGGDRVWMMRHGFLREVPGAWATGDVIWADDSGQPTNVRPDPTKVRVKLGVVYADQGDGGPWGIFVDVRVYPPLGELSGLDLESTTPTEREVLMVRDVGGTLGFQNRPIRRSADYAGDFTVDPDTYLSRVDASGGVVVATLPAPEPDVVVNIKKTDDTVNVVTIDAVANGGTIDGEDTFDLELQSENLTLQCDGFSWAVI